MQARVEEYDEYMRGCRRMYGERMGFKRDVYEDSRLETLRRQPQSMVVSVRTNG